jgi:hypothetical protein
VFGSPIGKSDHIGLVWTTITHLDPNSLDGRPKGRNYWKGDYESINTEIRALDWQAVLGEMDTDDAWQELERRIGNLCDKYVPEKRKPKKNPRPRWMTKPVRNAVKKKRKLYLQYCRLRRTKDHNEYVKQRNITTSLCEEAKKNCERNLVDTFKDNPKNLWVCTGMGMYGKSRKSRCE